MSSKRFMSLVAPAAVFLILVLSAARMSFAQEMSAEDKKMMEMMMKYGTPGKNHEFLKKYVGEFDVEVKSWSKPGTEPMISKGTMKNELIFDGRYIKCKFDSMMMGMNYMGLEIIGYDLFKNTYVTFWIDSMSTGFATFSGSLDESGKVLTETGEFPDPMTAGKTTQKVKNVTKFVEDGKYMFAMFMIQPDGTEFKSMELTATRKK